MNVSLLLTKDRKKVNHMLDLIKGEEKKKELRELRRRSSAATASSRVKAPRRITHAIVETSEQVKFDASIKKLPDDMSNIDEMRQQLNCLKKCTFLI